MQAQCIGPGKSVRHREPPGPGAPRPEAAGRRRAGDRRPKVTGARLRRRSEAPVVISG
ncbi:hypothetical protein GCM10010495_47330 [Kitasatospora herbaricolor]|nr:hypothetical protein GCM10010495_47330 [Kitasatospora herbaricolor]